MLYVNQMRDVLRSFNDEAKKVHALCAEYVARYAKDVAARKLKELNAAFVQTHDNARDKIEAIYAAAVASVDAWATMDGTKVNDGDLRLLAGGFPVSASDLRAMLLRNADSYTMIQRIKQYAQEHDMLFSLGFTPEPEDKKFVYDAFRTSALSLLDTIYSSAEGGVSDLFVDAYGDPSMLHDPKYIITLLGLDELYKRNTAAAGADAAGTFGFHFRPLPGRAGA